MFDDINLSKEGIKRFKAGARQYAQLEFSNVYFSNGNKLNSFGNEVDSNGQAVIPNRGDTLRALIQERLRLDGVSVEFASVTGNTFELGTMCAAEVKIEFDRDGLDEFYFDEAVVKVNIGVMLSNGSYEWAGFGVYNIDEVKKTKHRITLTGLDNMMKFTKLCDTNNEATFVFREGDTVSQAIMAVCDLCGVSYNSPELIALTNGSYNIINP